MKRKHKTYSRPKKPFDKQRIDDEKIIEEEYGLKNKTEIWKAEAKIKKIREKAKKVISAKPEEQKMFFEKINKMGLNTRTIADVLALEKKDYLERRLQTIIFRKKIANTPKQARQFIVHKKILVDGRIVNSPSFVVPANLEEKIEIKKNKIKEK